MPELSDVIILALATWRLSHMLVTEQCPFSVCVWMRERIGGALTCIYCTSVWVAVLHLFLWYSVGKPLVIIFAISGFALMLRSYTGVGIHD